MEVDERITTPKSSSNNVIGDAFGRAFDLLKAGFWTFVAAFVMGYFVHWFFSLDDDDVKQARMAAILLENESYRAQVKEYENYINTTLTGYHDKLGLNLKSDPETWADQLKHKFMSFVPGEKEYIKGETKYIKGETRYIKGKCKPVSKEDVELDKAVLRKLEAAIDG